MKEDTLTGIQIRMAAPADAPSISAVLRETVAEYRASYTDEAFAAAAPASEQIQSRMNEGPIWVAVRETAINRVRMAVPSRRHLTKGVMICAETKSSLHTQV
jgi:hypothetical protein